MNKTLGIELIIFGVLLAGFGCLVHYLAPTIARPTPIAGLTGAALCLVWGVRAVLGRRGKALPILTLIVIRYVLLSQAVISAVATVEAVSGRRIAAQPITLLGLSSVAMLMTIAYAGVTFDGQLAEPTQSGTTDKPETQPNTSRRP